ncbi:glycosyltransferase [Hirschia baltica]|uniref:Glycosyl transferase family 2 n=1 Tax=Hirschia baltica (strain ATCC 49814 / DSM 5838 / IFAM 1418) TaxID=582402 RepID=C6XS30_HIRBI|nr:glycosyltransferase [Hirschia baltica]ACT60871.1 glycosyl transferase family 2 [Hirschia baltica ATCC 49814]
MQKPQKFFIVTPVLDDWESLDKLIEDISAQPELAPHDIRILAVDDGSSAYERPNPERLVGPIKEIVVAHLRANQSHQRAIALGMAYVKEHYSEFSVLVMDSDGEDRPEEVAQLVERAADKPNSIIVARRRKRSEGTQFRAGYWVYKLLFSLLTGKDISFGNFSFIPQSKIDNVIYNSNIWNNFAATILRSRVPIEFVETDRGTRYFGESRMNVTSLMVHGLSAIAVFSDIVISRLIIALTGMFVLFSFGILAVIAAKFAVDYYNIPGLFLPGYATNIILALVNILVSSLFIGLLMILNLLTTRSQATALPSQLMVELIGKVETITLSEKAN